MRSFWEEQAMWSQKTFGTDQERGPIGALKHLAKEVQETLECANDPQTPRPKYLEEFADCIFLVFDACRRAGFSYDELLLSCWRKLAKNRRRQWQKPAKGDEPVEHVRDASA